MAAAHARSGAEDGAAVEAHDEGEVAVVDGMGQAEDVLAVGLGQVEDGEDLLDAVRDVEVGVLGRLIAWLAVGVGLQVTEERRVVVDARVWRVVQGRGEAAGGRERSGVHDHVGEARAVHAREDVGHDLGVVTICFKYERTRHI